MDRRARDAVAGDADEAYQSRARASTAALERAARAEGYRPLRLVHEIVELDQVDVVGLQPLQRVVEPGLGLAYVRSPVLVARKKRSRWRGIQGPTWSSERRRRQPYRCG